MKIIKATSGLEKKERILKDLDSTWMEVRTEDVSRYGTFFHLNRIEAHTYTPNSSRLSDQKRARA